MYLSNAFQKPRSRVKTAHTVNSAAGRCRRTAEVHAGERRAIEAPCGAEEKLPDIERPAVEIAAHQIGIVAFHGGGAENVPPPRNALAEARGKTLPLPLNGSRHVRRRAVRHVAVGPGGMLSIGSAGGVEKGVLHEENKRTAGVARFPLGDLVER